MRYPCCWTYPRHRCRSRCWRCKCRWSNPAPPVPLYLLPALVPLKLPALLVPLELPYNVGAPQGVDIVDVAGAALHSRCCWTYLPCQCHSRC
jgi:hypothetical protein